jgi:hypothetical protein
MKPPPRLRNALALQKAKVNTVGFQRNPQWQKAGLNKLLPVFMGMVLLTVVATPRVEAQFTPFPLFIFDCLSEPIEELQSKLAMLRTEKARNVTVIQRLKEELRRAEQENRKPDVNKTRDTLATAGGARGQAYRERPPYIQGLVDHYEALYQPYNWLDAMWIPIDAARLGVARQHFETEITRHERFVSVLEDEEGRLNGCLKLHEARRNNDQPECPSGAYLVACDPGMGGGPPDLGGGTDFGGGIPPQGPTSGAAGGGSPVDQPGLTPPPPGPGQAPPPYPGYSCGSPGYPPCPPGYYPPGPYGGESPVQVPWQGLVPPPGSPGQPPSGGGGPCPPGCHVRPDGGGCDCPGAPANPCGGGCSGGRC